MTPQRPVNAGHHTNQTGANQMENLSIKDSCALAALAIQNMTAAETATFMTADAETQSAMAFNHAKDAIQKRITMGEILLNDESKMAAMVGIVYDNLAA